MKKKQSISLVISSHIDAQGEHIFPWVSVEYGSIFLPYQHLGLLKSTGKLLSGEARTVRTLGVKSKRWLHSSRVRKEEKEGIKETQEKPHCKRKEENINKEHMEKCKLTLIIWEISLGQASHTACLGGKTVPMANLLYNLINRDSYSAS